MDHPQPFDQICGACGLTFGSHRRKNNGCPAHEARMDWTGLSTFQPTGTYALIEPGTPATNAPCSCSTYQPGGACCSAVIREAIAGDDLAQEAGP